MRKPAANNIPRLSLARIWFKAKAAGSRESDYSIATTFLSLGKVFSAILLVLS